MKYTREIRRAITQAPLDVRVQLSKDYYYNYLEYIHGGSWKLIEGKFFTRMWLEDFGIWNYWGGTTIVPHDKNEYFPTTDENWIGKIQSCYEHIYSRTNRKIFGRRYFWKEKRTPPSLVFFEKGDGGQGRHIHSIHHFPPTIKDKSEEWMKLFGSLWRDHDLNRPVGRNFWWEPVDTDIHSQSKVISYASKKMNNNYEYGWFPVV